MLDIHKIVVPVDFHQHTEELALFAIDVANKIEAVPVFIHVIENFTLSAEYGDIVPASFSQMENEMRSQAEQKMKELINNNKSTCPECTGKILIGDVADCIVDFADKEKSIGLIIMATHGTKGIEKILLGSVADRVLKRAHCPILVFNPYRGERGYKITSSIAEVVQPV
nr:universal stress protein [uncultured Desulfobulbus sp.]